MPNLEELCQIEDLIKKKIDFWQKQLEIVQAYKINKEEKETVTPEYEYVETTKTWYEEE